ncbi:MAG: ribonuclease III domain-containing protein [Clostridia bacterium]|nr:ribonuclease III domain-containing protein [Clostridia bacterium]
MEKSMSEAFGFTPENVKSYSPLALAYIGDSVHTLYIRTRIMAAGDKKVNELHKICSRFVKAKAQSDAIHALLPILTEEEEAVYKRGRNAKSYTTAKNADVTTYRHATGFEALIGYLYLCKNNEQLNFLLDRSYEIIKTEEK